MEHNFRILERKNKYRDSETGAAMVEMAIVLPVFFLLFVAIIDLFAILSVRDQATSVAQVAGREAMIAISNFELCDDVLDTVKSRFERDMPNYPVHSSISYTPRDFPQNIEVGVVNLNIEADLPCILCHSMFRDITYRNSLTYIVESGDKVECGTSLP